MCKTERENLQRCNIYVKKCGVILSELLWNLCFITWWILLCLYIFTDSERSIPIASKCFCESHRFIIIKHFAFKPTQRGELHTFRHCPQNLWSVHLQLTCYWQTETSPVPTLSLALEPEMWKEGRKLVRKWTQFLQKLSACVCLGKNISAELCLSKMNWLSPSSVCISICVQLSSRRIAWLIEHFSVFTSEVLPRESCPYSDYIWNITTRQNWLKIK